MQDKMIADTFHIQTVFSNILNFSTSQAYTNMCYKKEALSHITNITINLSFRYQICAYLYFYSLNQI